MSIFGQVWLWSLLAFVIGAVLTWLVLVLPARKRIRTLESRLAVAHAETTRAVVQQPAQPVDEAAATTTYLERHAIGTFDEEQQYSEPTTVEPALYPESALDHYPELEIHKETDPFEEQFAEFDELAARPSSQPTFEPEPERSISPPTEYFQPVPEAEAEPEPPVADLLESSLSDTLEPSVGESLFQPGVEPEHEQHPEPEPLVPRWFDRDEEEDLPERSPFEEPSAPHSYFDDSPATELFQAPAARHAEPVADVGGHEAAEPEAPQFGGIEPLPEAEHVETTYAFGSADRPEPSGVSESPMEETQILPKRQRRESPRGGFDPPRPIQPSMRAVERREPSPELTGGHSGSLFEPSVPPNQQTPPEPVASRHQVADSSVPAGPFGPGSAMPRPGGGRPADEFAVKASVTALRYCTEDSAQFPRMVAEVWFRTPDDAERVGFRPLT
ncbi:MAG: hypothetical protein JWQ81_6758 [Amycolatopsis sp.]|jgi:hypothetical protein|uniref:sunset domain-containing protein n=1 Tax=Amycolatopsis sp. TaxID=37632 RepID=UPI00261F8CFF|nr:hypothetical protein [Amycolatopsis sp.]MCU1686019.1 hypothetical protein [Amycolatopsis sp.]